MVTLGDTLSTRPLATETSRVNPIVAAVLLLIAWTVPVTIQVSGHFVGMSMDGASMPASHALGQSVATWYPWLAATPLILFAYRRVPHRGRAAAAALPVHLALVLSVYMAQAALATAIGHRTAHVPLHVTTVDVAGRMISDLALYDLFIYLGVLAAIASLDLSRRYRARDLRASQLETQLAEARLSALQMQLQPHFLFNALNSIAMLVRQQQSREALDVIVGFGDLLRYVLDEAGTTDVPLRVELRFVRQYLEIERVRYGDRLTIVVEAPAELENALVPNLVLQPLVENAIKHGIGRRMAAGSVVVRAARNGSNLVLTVRNSGPTLPDAWRIEDSEGVGVRNVRDRLEASIGPHAGVTIVNAPDGSGVEATVILPFRTR